MVGNSGEDIKPAAFKEGSRQTYSFYFKRAVKFTSGTAFNAADIGHFSLASCAYF
jgi:hypothetical protein